MGKRFKLHEYTSENDIRYRGPLSYQGFQILGWLCIVATAYILLLQLTTRFNPEIIQSRQTLITILTYLSTLSLPFLLIANFAKILNNAEGYRIQLLRNGGAALGIFLAVSVIFSRYVVGLISRFVTDPENVVPVLNESFRVFQSNGFVAFNIFTDLFLCTLFMYFLTAQPKRVFTGKKRWIFRLFAVLPVAYEVGSMILKAKSAAFEIMLPIWSFPLLTVKPPMTFIVFMVLACYIKIRELRFRHHGKTHEEYQAFLKTNRNSLHFSVFMFIVMILAAIVDLVILTFMMVKAAPTEEALMHADAETATQYATVASAVGFGMACFPLALASPFVLLFSYTRLPKNKRISMMIPLAAIAIIIVLLTETAYQGLGSLSQKMQPVTIRELFDQFLLSLVGPADGA